MTTATAEWTLIEPLLILGALFAVVAWWVSDRNRQLRRLAERLGFSFRARGLFSRAPGPWDDLPPLPSNLRMNVNAVLSGHRNGHQVSFLQARAVSGATVDLPILGPHLVIDGRRGAERLWGAGAPPIHVIEQRGSEWGAFDEAFDVRSQDARFASAVIDARMMTALMGFSDGRTYVEVRGGHLLLARTRGVPLAEVETFLDRVIDLAEHVPTVARELYPLQP